MTLTIGYGSVTGDIQVYAVDSSLYVEKPNAYNL